ncbi:Hypothetical predicted protein, partial [Paramuricea clavata]
MEHMKPMGPLKMDGNVAENWRKWRQRWNLYAKASGANEKDEEIQCAIFLHTIGEEALEIYDTFTFTETEQDKIEPLIQKFESYCTPRKNTTYERYIFNTCVQNGRKLDAFILDLRNKAKTCEFESLQDSLIKDRIVCGIDSNSIRERLLRDNDLTLEKAISIVRATETSKTQVQKLNNPSLEVESIHKNFERTSRSKYQREETKPSRNVSKTQPCSRCGSNHAPKQCPGFGQTCRKCHGNNHFAKMCRSKNLNTQMSETRVHEVRKEETTDNSSTEEDELFIGEITTTTAKNVLITNLKVNGKNVNFKIDTGAQCNVLPEEIFDGIKQKPQLIAAGTKLTAYGGAQVPVKGKCVLEIEQTADRKMEVEFFVVKAPNAKALIGLQTCQNLELISINQISEIQEKKADIIEDYKDVFTGLGLVEGEYHIELQENAKATIQPPRKVPSSLIPKLKETLDNLTKSGVISKLDRPTDWVN